MRCILVFIAAFLIVAGINCATIMEARSSLDQPTNPIDQDTEANHRVRRTIKKDELYILNPGSAFPFIVTDPDSPILKSDQRQVDRICIPSMCNSVCRSWGFRIGRCNKQAICVCSR